MIGGIAATACADLCGARYLPALRHLGPVDHGA